MYAFVDDRGSGFLATAGAEEPGVKERKGWGLIK